MDNTIYFIIFPNIPYKQYLNFYVFPTFPLIIMYIFHIRKCFIHIFSLFFFYTLILVSQCIYPSMYPVYPYISLSLSVYIPPSLYLISLYSCLTLHLSIYVSHTHTSLCTSLPLSLTHPHTQTHVVFMCKCICVRSRRGINRIMYGAASRKGNSNPFIFDQFWGSPFKL